VIGELPRRAKGVVNALFPEASELFAQAGAAAIAGDRKSEKLLEQAENLFKHAQRSEGAARIAALLEMAKSEPGISVQPKELDADPWVLNSQNGTIDLKTGTLLPHSKSDLLTKITPSAYNPNARFELWDRFLAEVIPVPETRKYTQSCVGATTAGVADDDLLLVVHGEGGTGKGTFLNSIQSALGPYAASAELSTFTVRRDASAPQPDLARLQGKRLCAVSEPTTGETLSLLKRATGGDPISTRSHHQETFEYIPQFTMWVITNERPRVPHDDTGVWRRLKEIPFTTKFNNVDTSIRATLTNPQISGEAILAWAVEGCLNWQREGLGDLPQQVRDATAAYRDEMDALLDWIEENVENDSLHWVPFKESWDDYQAWAKGNGLRRPLGRKTFGQRLGEKYTPKKGTGGARGNIGLALRRGDSGISEMPLTPEGVGLSENSPHMEENLETKCHEMPLQAQSERGISVNEGPGRNATNSEMPLRLECAVCGDTVDRGSMIYLPDGDVRHSDCKEGE